MRIDGNENMEQPEYGCFFCRTGSELQVAREIERVLPMAAALVPTNVAWLILIQSNNRVHFYVFGEWLKNRINKGETGIVLSA